MRYSLALAAASMVAAASPASAAVQLRVTGTSGSFTVDTYRCTNGTCTFASSAPGGRGSVGFEVFAPDSVLTDAETIVTGRSDDGLVSFGAKILNTNGFLSAVNLVSAQAFTPLTPTFTGIRTVFTTTANVGTVFNVTAAAVPEPATWALMLAGFGMVGYALRRRRAAVAFA